MRLRFYAELNDFLARAYRRQEFGVRCARSATVKHTIEALGVPHTEVELILVDGAPVGFGRRLRQDERVSVYPHFASIALAPARRPARRERFIADAHLGGLARLLRMAGFDALYRNDYDDREIVSIAAQQRRIVLTRDRDLLKHRAVERGCYIYATLPLRQFSELVRRLDLGPAIRPFARCLQCNAPLRVVAKDELRDRLPPSVALRQTRFTACPVCRRVFWPGTHWQRMRELLGAAAPADRAEEAP